jgi:hypothetical protein
MGSVILTAKLIAGYDAVGVRDLGPDDPGAAGVLDLNHGPETATGPGLSSGPDSGGRPCRCAAAELAAAVQAVRAQEDAAARSVSLPALASR